MWLDTIHGTIERRVLLNYRLDPAALQRVLPLPFRPKLFRGHAIGGLCMIRFGGLRPRYTPSWVGLGSENAAHRIAVEWEEDGKRREGVFIPRRDTNSKFNRVFGGRIFPGIFRSSAFEIRETSSSISIRILHENGRDEVAFSGQLAECLPKTSIFPSVTEAAAFFSLGATGYSATKDPGHFHGMELRCLDWSIVPLAIAEARSSFFDDGERFPEGTVALDCALLMRAVAHQWHSRHDLYVTSNGVSLTTSKPSQPGIHDRSEST